MRLRERLEADPRPSPAAANSTSSLTFCERPLARALDTRLCDVGSSPAATSCAFCCFVSSSLYFLNCAGETLRKNAPRGSSDTDFTSGSEPAACSTDSDPRAAPAGRRANESPLAEAESGSNGSANCCGSGDEGTDEASFADEAFATSDRFIFLATSGSRRTRSRVCDVSSSCSSAVDFVFEGNVAAFSVVCES